MHAGVADEELFGAAGFDVLDAGEEDAGVGDDGAAGFEDDFGAAAAPPFGPALFEPLVEEGDDFFGVVGGGDGLAGGVVGAEAAAEVQDFDAVAVALEFVGEGENFEDGLDVGPRGEDG